MNSTEKRDTKKVVNNKLYLYNNIDIKTRVSEDLKTKLADDKEFELISKNVKDKLGEEHPFDYTLVEGMTKKFALVNSILDKIADFTVGPGINIVSENEKVIETIDTWRNKTNFDSFLFPWFKQALMKGPSYLETAGLTDSSKEAMLKVINSNSMFVKQDKHGTIEGYNQFIGKDLNSVSDDDVIPLSTDEAAMYVVNKIDTNPYGFGIVFPSLTALNEFLMAQTAIHKLTKRKANSPIHAILGNAEKDDYPDQSDIDSFGQKLQFMDESTEWVTGPNVEMKVLDFGSVGAKFTDVLINDYKLLSYSFQVPEVLLGSGSIPEGLAEVQMDAFERRIRSLQVDFGFAIREQIFDKVLSQAGLEKEDYDIIWGEQSEDDIIAKLKSIEGLLRSPGISEGMKLELETRVAEILHLDETKIDSKNAEVKVELEAEQKQLLDQQQQQQQQPVVKKAEGDKKDAVPKQ